MMDRFLGYLESTAPAQRLAEGRAVADKQSDMFLRAKMAFRTHPDGTSASAREICEQADIPFTMKDVVETARRDMLADNGHDILGRFLP